MRKLVFHNVKRFFKTIYSKRVFYDNSNIGSTPGELSMAVATCTFCKIVSGEVKALDVFEDDHSAAFLDHRPVFPGHVLLIPKIHFETLTDLPPEVIADLFGSAKFLAAAVETAMKAEGTFVAINNRVSQSVPHMHIHIVPRRKGDGLKGFFWPRQNYKSESEKLSTQQLIRKELESLKLSR
jgi:histidine triad (HIT) family protein